MFIPHREGLYGSYAQKQLRTTGKLPEQILTLTKTHLKSLDTECLIHQTLYYTDKLSYIVKLSAPLTIH
jgi:hypothetical protein